MRLGKIAKAACVLVLAATTALSSAFAAPLTAKVKSVSGKVELKKGEDWVQLKAGDVLQKGDVISTGFKSEATITANETTFTIGALTRVTLSDLVSGTNKDKTDLKLESGSVSANVKHDTKKMDFSVTTPVATASVRGTSFAIDSNANMTVKSGLVAYYLTGSDKKKDSNVENADDSATPDSNVFTSAEEVSSGANGIGVYEGQSTSTDPYSYTQTSPREWFAADAGVNSKGTSTIASQEMGTITASAGNSNGAGTSSLSGSKKTELDIIIDLY